MRNHPSINIFFLIILVILLLSLTLSSCGKKPVDPDNPGNPAAQQGAENPDNPGENKVENPEENTNQPEASENQPDADSQNQDNPGISEGQISSEIKEIDHVSGNGKAAMVTEARKYIGIQYTYGGTSPETGFDCSGLVFYVMKKCGYSPAVRTAAAFCDACSQITQDETEPGDLVFFKGTTGDSNKVSHVGIYAGDGKMIHAGTKGIAEVKLSSSYWIEHFYCYGRYTGK